MDILSGENPLSYCELGVFMHRRLEAPFSTSIPDAWYGFLRLTSTISQVGSLRFMAEFLDSALSTTIPMIDIGLPKPHPCNLNGAA